MNLYLKNVTICSTTDSYTIQKRKSNQVYVRGNEIVMVVLPPMLQHAPMFDR
jgi:small nuclear ribonucleoprotein (snRNP)-like protein